jgi:acylglycerol lipase
MIHKEGSFKGKNDLTIYYQLWLPEIHPKAVLLVAHGFAEHSGRYGNVINYFVPRGYAVYALDHRGHGRSEGKRVEYDDFNDYVVDLKTYYDLVHKENQDKKIFLIGHSMGSLISTLFTLQHQEDLKGLILSGGGVSRDEMILPIGRPLDSSHLSHDKKVIDDYDNDPLVYRGTVPSGRGKNDTRKKLPDLVHKITLPILIMAGTGSPMGDAQRSKLMYELVGSKDKTLKLYDGLYHEIFNEPEHPQIMADIETWLSAHL